MSYPPAWKCKDCPSYDLCKTCHTQFTDTGDHHTAGHVFENVASAAAAKLSTMIAVLLEHGGLDLRLKTDSAFGWTPIHYALYAGNESLARSLVDRLCSGNSYEVSERLGHAKQDVLRHMGAPLSLFRGLPSAVKVWQDDGVVVFCSFFSVRSNFCCPPGARGYYELVILEMDLYPSMALRLPPLTAFWQIRVTEWVTTKNHGWLMALQNVNGTMVKQNTSASGRLVTWWAWRVIWRRCRCSSPSTAALRHPMAVSLSSLQTQYSTVFLLPSLAEMARCAATWTRHPSSTRLRRPTSRCLSTFINIMPNVPQQFSDTCSLCLLGTRSCLH